ncbi:MAG: nucleotide exchange factor GrpE [Candidatus Omnitrophica bacterium CG08_land_8_20_14_0_20_41_16]|uniref:Protein GrpE n=1 Tax=Candidatus Sherwoodlollariibacterium unditelluris TaxID=1974757 RepID=A0A2G9YMY2_9BACT|nr:MAG: nucleotide exchange factor GrpE [Candidatus Omnitrophica bacterium CG23_combo_of_CG06-09_8_20_14_all_41_10]PIS33978.1 MAG: nucleotide exchange factor GrpE [Candidatus Omnitrophica bacterium CG08_land_8_20_14_0_20_41_16]
MMNQDKENNKKEEKDVILKESEYLKLKEDADKSAEFADKVLRLQADFENTRKRIEREKQDFVKFANEGIILELLNVLDDLERTVNLAEAQKQDPQAFLKGVEMILAHLYEMLKEYGVKPIETEGKLFDPHYQEVLMQEENKDLPEHTVIEELQKGYLLNERVIRTAKVKVSKKKME